MPKLLPEKPITDFFHFFHFKSKERGIRKFAQYLALGVTCIGSGGFIVGGMALIFLFPYTIPFLFGAVLLNSLPLLKLVGIAMAGCLALPIVGAIVGGAMAPFYAVGKSLSDFIHHLKEKKTAKHTTSLEVKKENNPAEKLELSDTKMNAVLRTDRQADEQALPLPLINIPAPEVPHHAKNKISEWKDKCKVSYHSFKDAIKFGLCHRTKPLDKEPELAGNPSYRK